MSWFTRTTPATRESRRLLKVWFAEQWRGKISPMARYWARSQRSEERRVGEEGRFRWWPHHLKKKKNRRRLAFEVRNTELLIHLLENSGLLLHTHPGGEVAIALYIAWYRRLNIDPLPRLGLLLYA